MNEVVQNYKVDELLPIAVAHYFRFQKDHPTAYLMDDYDAGRAYGLHEGYHTAMEMVFGFNKWTDAIKAANATY